MKQENNLNTNAAVYNCNFCGDVQIRMTGNGEQQPEEGCYNPFCPSNDFFNLSGYCVLDVFPSSKDKTSCNGEKCFSCWRKYIEKRTK